MLEQLIIFRAEIQTLIKEGKSLREISQWSYNQRETGRNIPYLTISDAIPDPQDGRKTIVTGLWATPIAKQKELKKFFSIKAPEMDMLSKWTLRVFIEEESSEVLVWLKEKLGKGVDNYKLH